MNKGKKSTPKNLMFMRKMPPLRHKAGEPFDPESSEVLKWIQSNLDAAKYILEISTSPNRRGGCLIEFDQKTGSWYGMDYEGGE